MADQILSIQPVSATLTASQVALSSRDVMPNIKEIDRELQSKSYKDKYAGPTAVDYTYSNLIKNNIKPKASDILYSSADIAPNKDQVFISQEASRQNARSITPRPADVLPKARDMVASAKDLLKEGDVRHKIVKDITTEVEKSIKEWNKYNLSKSNRLLKTIETFIA